MSAWITAWRCLPWDPAAREGEPFSPSHFPSSQSAGRFDLADQPPILYLTEDSAQAVAEVLQGFRNSRFQPGMLRRYGHAFAIVEVTFAASVRARVADLCDPPALIRLEVTPDRTAHHDRTVTQQIARRIHDAAEHYAGLRWWSTLTGAWHTIALFGDRLSSDDISFGTPRVVTPADAEVTTARQFLNLR